MNQLQRLTLAVIVSLVAGCAMKASTPPLPQPDASAVTAADGTTLLVSLEDGTIIKQVIHVGADICFKQNAASTTTCFTQGEAIIDPLSNAVIGYKMIEGTIELVAKSD